MTAGTLSGRVLCIANSTDGVLVPQQGVFIPALNRFCNILDYTYDLMIPLWRP